MENNFELHLPVRGVPVKTWTKGVPVDPEAIAQLQNIAKLPFIHKHVAGMPDMHVGVGATVGSVIATTKAIIPAAVGVDIGCGMMAVKTSLTASQLPSNLATLRSSIEQAVPHGRTDDGGVNDRGAWGFVPEHVLRTFSNELSEQFKDTLDKFPNFTRNFTRAPTQLGTLGTGNHFVEICLDKGEQFAKDSNIASTEISVEPSVWIMLHSGSRGIGNAIGKFFIEKAKEEMKRFFINLPDIDLAYLPEGSMYFDDYIKALNWAQTYARLNRELMMSNTIMAMKKTLGLDFTHNEVAVNCHHNYVNKEHHYGKNVYVTRKGAVRARQGDLGIIPGSMGAKSFIVKGKGNEESFSSCSHGAGRVMSRTQAKKLISLEEHIESTKGVECRKDIDVIDESPNAYKPIEAVMKAQEDLVEILYTLKQVLCVKG